MQHLKDGEHKIVLKFLNDCVVSYLLSLYSQLNSGDNNSGQQEQPGREQVDIF